jgi:hypothetical protein
MSLDSKTTTNSWVFPCFTIEQVKEINKVIKNNTLQKEDVNTKAKASKVGDFFGILCAPVMHLIHPWLYQCQLINKEIYGYDIDWHFHLDYANYNVYGNSGEYDWHIDATPKIASDLKLTCILNLSEESYEGGEFLLINASPQKIKFETGDGLVFNSLIAHKITPVTKGERITLTYWASGSNWK